MGTSDIFMSSGCLFAEYSAQDVLWESCKGKVFTSNLEACIWVPALCNLHVCEGIGLWIWHDEWTIITDFHHILSFRTRASVCLYLPSCICQCSNSWYKWVNLCYLLSYLILSKIWGSIIWILHGEDNPRILCKKTLIQACAFLVLTVYCIKHITVLCC